MWLLKAVIWVTRLSFLSAVGGVLVYKVVPVFGAEASVYAGKIGLLTTAVLAGFLAARDKPRIL